MAPRTGLAATRAARAHVGHAEYHNMCKSFVRGVVYGIEPSQSPTAIAAWNQAVHKHPLRNDQIEDIPWAVPVWYDTSNTAEHIATSIRRDRQGHRLLVTTDGRDGRITIVRARDLLSWGPVIGWAEDLDGQRVWDPR